jgi:hypothetical protein
VPQTDIPRSLNEPCRAGFLAHILVLARPT